ncbi:hypothetical protein TVAG_149800 [Trichomonas vaginalis G3]|uniref:Macro domain-containing protein n=1 Tax=Trichomonas vaginalis (strain ATCC PRA-98 / G3) TaxID=412133 RepID=A2FIL1_TRIV3|nr:Macro Poa1p-like domain-containing protein [Trichomonas vaginalis G3]EAX95260.1 hypothetical protein TVAG_149800 [Trichomonas vaginalis G3]KAI5531910.1 Macro Poa1p-like domain-containing protein [Trichomonas vaginalis G3]|eukprot:XP_001308190.1 hypothetical protein [Trichomonas vaginalis G3]
MLSIVEEDITEAKEKYIVHQCNCITKYAKGLAKQIFDKFPYSNVYKNRERYSANIPGAIIVCGNGTDQRYVINLIGQFSAGKPTKSDTIENREGYFQSCLSEIAKIDNLESIAFPYRIGCGLAGGNWESYEKMLRNFAEEVKVPVVLYKFEEKK